MNSTRLRRLPVAALLAQGVRQALAKVEVVATIPTETLLTCPIAAVAGSPKPEAARKFLDFVLTPAAQAVLSRYGFGKP